MRVVDKMWVLTALGRVLTRGSPSTQGAARGRRDLFQRYQPPRYEVRRLVSLPLQTRYPAVMLSPPAVLTTHDWSLWT
jgi:hypothetical protein